MTGSVIAREVAAAYAEAGVEAGDGRGALQVTIHRPGAPSGLAHSPTPGRPALHTFVARPAEAKYMRREGAVLKEGERVYSLVNSGVTVVPAIGDKLTPGTAEHFHANSHSAEVWSVQEVIEQNPAGHVISWMVRVGR